MVGIIPKRNRTFSELSLLSKTVVVAGALFILVGLIAALAYVFRPVEKPVEKKISIADRPSVVAFSKSDLTPASLTKMLKANFQLGHGIFEIGVNDYTAGSRLNQKQVTIVYDETATSSEILRFRACQNTRILIPILFLNPQAAEVSLQARTLVKDISGAEDETPVIKITIKRSQANKINWDKIDPDKIPRVVNSYWVHPSLRG